MSKAQRFCLAMAIFLIIFAIALEGGLSSPQTVVLGLVLLFVVGFVVVD